MEGAHIYDHDRLNWSTAEDAMKGSHVKEVKKMIEEFQRIKVLSLTGSKVLSLTVNKSIQDFEQQYCQRCSLVVDGIILYIFSTLLGTL
jgi:hypothetical protein